MNFWKNIFIFLFLTIQSVGWTQLPTTTFDPPICNYNIDYNYSYVNTPNGYKILRNGIEIYGANNSYNISLGCLALKFISNSTGFKITYLAGSGTPYLIVEKTSNYGNTWLEIGRSLLPYDNFYIVNEHLGYLISSGGLNALRIVRCSDVEPPPYPSPYFISLTGTTTGGQTLIKNDIIPGNSICPEDSLVIKCFGNGTSDTNKVVINLSYKEYIDNRPGDPFYIFPNPAKTDITINNIYFKQIDLINMQGIVVKTVYGYTHELKVHELANGLYVLRIVDLSDNSHYSKFIKQDNGL
ncbi:MAG: T9SS type A sorting domain-containing protein [Bacteroidetes bacterium]|nr:T9SS type A sorting domain-containing protein [Bacteroidota bacterium]